MWLIISDESLMIGVHDARISISDSSERGESFPKEALATRVTVPLGDANWHPLFSNDAKIKKSGPSSCFLLNA